MADPQELAEPSKSPIGKLELERLLLDAVRRGIEDKDAPILDQPMATNDNQPAWPLIPFPERQSPPVTSASSASCK
jgi:hypothetical protein